MLRKLVLGRAGTAAARVVFCVLVGLLAACQIPQATQPSLPSPTETPLPQPFPTATPRPLPSATATPGPLSESEATALIEEGLALRRVDPETVRLTFREEPRTLSLRFTSPYDFDSIAYRAHCVLVPILVSGIGLRVQPPLDDGIKISVIPQGSEEVGLHIISIMGSSLEAWAEGALSNSEFVAEWTVGILTKE